MMTILAILVLLCLLACGSAYIDQPARDLATTNHCEDVGRAGPDGGHIKAWQDCLREAGLAE